jgi:rhodanese-related sulfurtransferase
MPEPIDRDQVRRLASEGAQLIEVLPEEEYGWAHLAGARNIPLRALADRAGEIDGHTPCIVYCHDLQCDMSPRAAWQLESLGFPQVYDYQEGKVDWLAFNLPHEGTADFVGDHLDTVETCALGERLDAVEQRLGGVPPVCVVLNGAGIVMGTVGAGDFAEHPDLPAGRVMRPGVSTYRPGVEVGELTERLRQHGLERAIVTSSDGALLGLFAPRAP